MQVYCGTAKLMVVISKFAVIILAFASSLLFAFIIEIRILNVILCLWHLIFGRKERFLCNLMCCEN